MVICYVEISEQILGVRMLDRVDLLSVEPGRLSLPQNGHLTGSVNSYGGPEAILDGSDGKLAPESDAADTSSRDATREWIDHGRGGLLRADWLAGRLFKMFSNRVRGPGLVDNRFMTAAGVPLRSEPAPGPAPEDSTPNPSVSAGSAPECWENAICGPELMLCLS